jgi:hypothetical protein
MNLWPVYVPCLIEEALIITLTVMKIFFDNKKDMMTDSAREENARLGVDEANKTLEEGGTAVDDAFNNDEKM